ncbi:hypothetical protein Pd630_LPD04863 [Rhodococcus opacus PD630]|nr:hypothetical protein Pd630_LPD04863 [Rhodococcus opacus PD630]
MQAALVGSTVRETVHPAPPKSMRSASKGSTTGVVRGRDRR